MKPALYKTAAVLAMLWLFGLATSSMVGGLIHVLLMAFIVAALLGIIGRPGRRT